MSLNHDISQGLTSLLELTRVSSIREQLHSIPWESLPVEVQSLETITCIPCYNTLIFTPALSSTAQRIYLNLVRVFYSFVHSNIDNMLKFAANPATGSSPCDTLSSTHSTIGLFLRLFNNMSFVPDSFSIFFPSPSDSSADQHVAHNHHVMLPNHHIFSLLATVMCFLQFLSTGAISSFPQFGPEPMINLFSTHFASQGQTPTSHIAFPFEAGEDDKTIVTRSIARVSVLIDHTPVISSILHSVVSSETAEQFFALNRAHLTLSPSTVQLGISLHRDCSHLSLQDFAEVLMLHNSFLHLKAATMIVPVVRVRKTAPLSIQELISPQPINDDAVSCDLMTMVASVFRSLSDQLSTHNDFISTIIELQPPQTATQLLFHPENQHKSNDQTSPTPTSFFSRLGLSHIYLTSTPVISASLLSFYTGDAYDLVLPPPLTADNTTLCPPQHKITSDSSSLEFCRQWFFDTKSSLGSTHCAPIAWNTAQIARYPTLVSLWSFILRDFVQGYLTCAVSLPLSFSGTSSHQSAMLYAVRSISMTSLRMLAAVPITLLRLVTSANSLAETIASVIDLRRRQESDPQAQVQQLTQQQSTPQPDVLLDPKQRKTVHLLFNQTTTINLFSISSLLQQFWDYQTALQHHFSPQDQYTELYSEFRQFLVDSFSDEYDCSSQPCSELKFAFDVGIDTSHLDADIVCPATSIQAEYVDHDTMALSPRLEAALHLPDDPNDATTALISVQNSAIFPRSLYPSHAEMCHIDAFFSHLPICQQPLKGLWHSDAESASDIPSHGATAGGNNSISFVGSFGPSSLSALTHVLLQLVIAGKNIIPLSDTAASSSSPSSGPPAYPLLEASHPLHMTLNVYNSLLTSLFAPLLFDSFSHIMQWTQALSNRKLLSLQQVIFHQICIEQLIHATSDAMSALAPIFLSSDPSQHLLNNPTAWPFFFSLTTHLFAIADSYTLHPSIPLGSSQLHHQLQQHSAHNNINIGNNNNNNNNDDNSLLTATFQLISHELSFGISPQAVDPAFPPRLLKVFTSLGYRAIVLLGYLFGHQLPKHRMHSNSARSSNAAAGSTTSPISNDDFVPICQPLSHAHLATLSAAYIARYLTPTAQSYPNLPIAQLSAPMPDDFISAFDAAATSPVILQHCDSPQTISIASWIRHLVLIAPSPLLDVLEAMLVSATNASLFFLHVSNEQLKPCNIHPLHVFFTPDVFAVLVQVLVLGWDASSLRKNAQLTLPQDEPDHLAIMQAVFTTFQTLLSNFASKQSPSDDQLNPERFLPLISTFPAFEAFPSYVLQHKLPLLQSLVIRTLRFSAASLVNAVQQRVFVAKLPLLITPLQCIDLITSCFALVQFCPQVHLRYEAARLFGFITSAVKLFNSNGKNIHSIAQIASILDIQSTCAVSSSYCESALPIATATTTIHQQKVTNHHVLFLHSYIKQFSNKALEHNIPTISSVVYNAIAQSPIPNNNQQQQQQEELGRPQAAINPFGQSVSAPPQSTAGSKSRTKTSGKKKNAKASDDDGPRVFQLILGQLLQHKDPTLTSEAHNALKALGLA